MSKRETKFYEPWNEKYPWVCKDRSSVHYARYSVCSKSFSITKFVPNPSELFMLICIFYISVVFNCVVTAFYSNILRK